MVPNDSMRGPVRPESHTWLGHPKGVFLIAFAELWERFSYFALAALMTLYLTSPLDAGGWGWNRSDAFLFYGLFGGLIYVVPVFGAWIANNHLGERRCIALGAALLLLGHLLLGGPAYLPQLISYITQIDGRAIIEQAAVPLGRIWALDAVRPALAAAAGTPHASAVAAWTYVSSSGFFLLGLACIVIATGLFKSPVASIVSKLYASGDARRDVGYAVLFTCIYVGAVLANFVAGSLGEIFGWHYGFLSAALGIALGLAVYFWKERQYLGSIGVLPDRARGADEVAARPAAVTYEERDRLFVLLLQGALTTVYAAAFYQKNGLITLYIRDQVDRTVGDLTIPTTWFLTVSPLVFMVVTPLLALVFLRLARSDRNPSASYKLAAGLLVIGAAYALIASAEAARLASDSATILALWPLAMFVCFGISDALVWPNQMALATKLSPRRYNALVIGAWHLTVGIGIWLAGIIGATAAHFGTLEVFTGLAALCLIAGAGTALSTPRMRRWMHGAEHTSILAPRAA